MFNYLIKFALLCVLTISLQATTKSDSGLTQPHLISISPENLAEFESPYTTVEIVFSMPIKPESVHKNSIELKIVSDKKDKKHDKHKKDKKDKKHDKHKKYKKVKGTSTVIGNKIIFKPNTALQVGTYKVKVKKIKLESFSTKDIKTKKIKYTFSVPEIKAIEIVQQSINIKETTQIQLFIIKTYADNTTEEVSGNNTEWIIQDNSIAFISNGTLTGTKEGLTTIQAKLNNITSPPVSVLVYKEINGYKLPPEPDPTVNNSTILGIDSNGNGVRDDVEIYIIKRFAQDPEFPKTKTAIAMQYAWASQKILENPIIDSKKYSDDAMDCQYYWVETKTQQMSGFDALQYHLKHEVFNNPKIKDKIYNTRERIEQKFSYNSVLSGNIFSGRGENIVSKCQINIDELGE